MGFRVATLGLRVATQGHGNGTLLWVFRVATLGLRVATQGHGNGTWETGPGKRDLGKETLEKRLGKNLGKET